ncbi:hypothetical protein [Bythopirellula polymerisocia]|uniref:Secreted protein n=1 Tax=Bythopirellula polymerisocia TaxID=2528003 RepID=A0A5C6CRA7_9BACT|nr:hypothetical protein [Bythopirellula polymerisocia]TWU26067.1 hypothetical protein Pla144_32840 [Bythopirellula polymerisocia]
MKRMLSHSIFSQLAMLTSFLAAAGVSEAQLVQVGPGYVKAPFVRVYRTPYGTSVRAPFTRVDGGTPAYGRHYRQRPSVDQQVDTYNDVDQGADLSLLERQRRLVAKSASRLERDLSGFRSASHWQAILRLPAEFRQGQTAGESSMVQPDPIAVKSALDNFDEVASNDQLRKIAQLHSFRSTHRLLREYVSLLSLPSEEPLTSGPAADEQPPVEIPSPVEQPVEELPLPLLEFPQ